MSPSGSEKSLPSGGPPAASAPRTASKIRLGQLTQEQRKARGEALAVDYQLLAKLAPFARLHESLTAALLLADSADAKNRIRMALGEFSEARGGRASDLSDAAGAIEAVATDLKK